MTRKKNNKKFIECLIKQAFQHTSDVTSHSLHNSCIDNSFWLNRNKKIVSWIFQYLNKLELVVITLNIVEYISIYSTMHIVLTYVRTIFNWLNGLNLIRLNDGILIMFNWPLVIDQAIWIVFNQKVITTMGRKIKNKMDFYLMEIKRFSRYRFDDRQCNVVIDKLVNRPDDLYD